MWVDFVFIRKLMSSLRSVQDFSLVSRISAGQAVSFHPRLPDAVGQGLEKNL
jgi:hypothetical protein